MYPYSKKKVDYSEKNRFVEKKANLSSYTFIVTDKFSLLCNFLLLDALYPKNKVIVY